MFVDKQAVLELLDDAKISYQWVEHEAVYTIDDANHLAPIPQTLFFITSYHPAGHQ